MKMNAPIIFCAIVFICISNVIHAQDTLPNFTVRDLGKDKIQISWVNPYENCIQLAVQRSFDSTRFFRTIYAAQSPGLPQNGFVDTKLAQGVKVFYRVFYVLSEGNYFFTQAKTPHPDLPYAPNLASAVAISPGTLPPVVQPTTTPRQIITIYLRNTNTLLAQLDYYPDYTRFRDSIIAKTKDSLQLISATQVLLKPYVAKVVWKPSLFVFTNTHGFITISLPALRMHKYKLVVYEEDGTQLFEIKQIKESPLTLDKANFIHAGWFSFELYEDDKVKEHNKFYVGKEF